MATLLGALVGGSVDVAWLALAPPRAADRGQGIAAVLAAAAVVAVIVSVRRLRVVVGAWGGLCGAATWSTLVAGWLLVFPGMRWAGGIFLFGAGAFSAALCLGVVMVARWRFDRTDSAAGIVLLAVASLVAVAAFGPLTRLGITVRFALVRDDYVSATADDRVEVTGGFVDGDLSGWVWIDALVLDPAGGIVHDPDDSLSEALGDRRLIGGTGERFDECERLTAQWFWCTFA